MNIHRINGVDLAYEARGAGRPVMFVHGFPLDHTMWHAQIEALSADYRVIAPDLRGFGRSNVTRGTVTMEQFADDLAALADDLGAAEPLVLVGLSMGGYIALQFWQRHAARLGALVLCDTRAAADTPEGAAGREETAQRVLREGPAPVADTMLPKLLTDATRREHPDLEASLRRVILATDPEGIAAATRGMARRPDMTAALARIACPALVLVGRGDVISTPEEMSGMARLMPHARFVEIPGAGHLAPLEQPAAVTAVLAEFLHSLS